ncbi:leucine-rich repeat receptor-like protein FASCIATED EAR2 [Canna indica]|uniref:Leucine-rich repeat receptor-like protein FASCIATED EAR2 n=1 Tax=Canna indica TaxID=4628 RepID=A0AAQ3QKL5_9LILI|nr:leucine-rich repeat receptor-like protein FASCIATED EAR2 [Canna indica]
MMMAARESCFCSCLRDHHHHLAVMVVLWLALMASSRGAVGILDPVDFLSLQAIRKGLEDMPGSGFFSAWDFTADPCGFPGVFCAGDRVVGLALGDPRAGSAGLEGRLDAAFGRLSALAELSLVPGRVAGPIPDALAQCPDLRFVALSKNMLSGAVPAGLGALPRLRTLDLSYNQLSGPIPPALAAAPALSNLILCHNQLSGSLPSFPDSAQLLRLDLKHNQLAGPVPSLPPTLQYLALGSNTLTGRVDSVLPRLTRLNFLDLSSNRLSGPIPMSVFSFPLAGLQLQRNAFFGPVALQEDVAIPMVDLSYNRLWGAVPPQLAPVSRLYLNNNRFSGEVPSRLVQGLNNGMQLLYLQHNFLTGIEIGPAASVIPMGASLCLQYNCMVPPFDTPCPLKAGSQKMRPVNQCPEWRG